MLYVSSLKLSWTTGLIGSIAIRGSGFALPFDDVDFKPLNKGSKKGRALDDESVCFTTAIGYHVIISGHFILGFQ